MLSLRVPSDKSITHRALFVAAQGIGRFEIENPLISRDTLATLNALRKLGVDIENASSPCIAVTSSGVGSWLKRIGEINCENSGTTARHIIALLASVDGTHAVVSGDGSLCKRPMNRIVSPLQKWGANIRWISDMDRLPIEISGFGLRANHEVTTHSAQIKSALLLAACQMNSEITIQCHRSARSHTEELFLWLGAKLDRHSQGHAETIRFQGPFVPEPFRLRVPGDPSSAAFLFASAAIRKNFELEILDLLVDPSRIHFLRCLETMGCNVNFRNCRQFGPYPVADVRLFCNGPLRAIKVSGEDIGHIIDEIPILAVCAGFAEGVSEFASVEELRVKESDRLLSILTLLNSAGVEVWESNHCLHVKGTMHRKRAFCFEPGGDHRLVMAAKVLSLFSDKECEIADHADVDVSFPGFFETIKEFEC